MVQQVLLAYAIEAMDPRVSHTFTRFGSLIVFLMFFAGPEFSRGTVAFFAGKKGQGRHVVSKTTTTVSQRIKCFIYKDRA